jgi:HPt (histidine-containing phosphotransfer) domain-containing protein
MMGGRMWVESKVGRGSVFYFTAIIKPGNPKQVPARQMSLAFDGDWLSPTSDGDRESASEGAEAPGVSARNKAGESSGADPDWADLAAMFLEDYPHKVKRLRDAAVIEDWSRAAELARSLCGEAGRAGAGRVAELATALEQAARDSQSREVKRLLAEMEKEMAVFQKAGPEES